jgi:hypothetical protein
LIRSRGICSHSKLRVSIDTGRLVKVLSTNRKEVGDLVVERMAMLQVISYGLRKNRESSHRIR